MSSPFRRLTTEILRWWYTVPQSINPNTDYHEWKRVLKEAGLREARLHDARHTAATVLLVPRQPTPTVMSLMGWSSQSMAARYQHVTDAMRSQVASQLGGRQGRPARRIVALLRAEIPADLPPGDWREAIRQLAGSLRDLVHRHPAAAPLLTSRQGLHEHLLRVCQGVLRLIREGGVPEVCAVALLRTVFPSGIGFALAELFLPEPPPPGPDSEIALIRQVTGLLTPQAPDELVRTALLVCGDYDIASQFHIGVDLMIRGLNAYLATLAADTPGEGGKGSAPAWHGRGARGPVTAPAVTSGQGWYRPPFA